MTYVKTQVHLMDGTPICIQPPNNWGVTVDVDGLEICCHTAVAVESLIEHLEVALVRLRDLEAQRAQHMNTVRSER